MFKPSTALAARAAPCYQVISPHLTALPRVGPLADATNKAITFAAGAATFVEQRPDAHSKHLPAPGSPIDPEQVAVAMGEKLDRLLGTVARSHGIAQPGARVVVLTADGRFEPQIAAHLAKAYHLNMADDAARAVLDQLGAELRDWVRTNPDDARRRGLEPADDGGVVLVCKEIKPVLAPLNKNP